MAAEEGEVIRKALKDLSRRAPTEQERLDTRKALEALEETSDSAMIVLSVAYWRTL
jgi:hypothetical protein